LKFIENRGNPDAFEPAPSAQESQSSSAPKPAEAKSNSQGATTSETYDVNVDGKVYRVEVAPSGTLTSVTPASDSQTQAQPQTKSAAPSASTSSQSIDAPLAGNVFKVLVRNGDSVSEGDVVMILEAMKMETEIRSAYTGTVTDITVGEGDAVTSGQPLILLG
ncbi:MAG: biotin/lipoyl-binding protein, partial [Enterobacterales bacterium]|nr:biotin/lipoyl-binding protein [Enterobacterales bacterium]